MRIGLFYNITCILNAYQFKTMIESIDLVNKKMVLAYDAKRLFNNFTGLGNYSRTLLKNLQKFYPQNEYHLFTPQAKKNVETEYFFDDSKFIIHTQKQFNPLWRTIGMSSEVNEINPHIFHGLSHEIPFGLNKQIKTVVTFHDLIYELFPAQFGMVDTMIYKLKYKSSAKRADRIIAISKSTKKDLETHYNIHSHKISVVYQSCNSIFQEENFHEFMVPLELSGISDYYLYVGSIIERKGLLQAIIAFSKLPAEYKKNFVVIGHGNNAYRKKINDLLQYYDLKDYFIFIDNIPNIDLSAVYEHCLGLVYVSIYEGFGIPVIECLFRNRPVITSNLSSMPEAAGPGGIVVDPYSPDDICLAMINLNNSNVREELIQKGYSYVKDNFAALKTTGNVMRVYEEMLQSG